MKDIYAQRFTPYERVRKTVLWQILCEEFLQQFVRKDDTIVDIGAGTCEFVNAIRCAQKIAIDLNPETKTYAHAGIEVIQSSTRHLKKILAGRNIDVFFMSNFLEHLDTKEEAFRLLRECFELLSPGGRVLIMQPDIARVGNAYWDFFDHKIPITEKSLVEVLKTVGFTITYTRSPFLPYSTKLRFIPLSPSLFKLYLHLRPLHFIFGKQFFVCGEKR